MITDNDAAFEKITPDDFFDSGNLKILICYLLVAVNEPIPATEMSQLFHYEGVANYFDTQTAIYDLERDACIEKAPNQKELYIITPKGKELSATLKENVSAALRSKVYNAVVKMLGRYKAERDTDIEITKTSDGCLFTCNAKNGDTVLLSFSILLPNEAQALELKNQILVDPKYYYEGFIKLLTEDLP